MRKLYHRAGVMSIESEKKASETEHVLSARKKFGENGEFYFLIKFYPRKNIKNEPKTTKNAQIKSCTHAAPLHGCGDGLRHNDEFRKEKHGSQSSSRRKYHRYAQCGCGKLRRGEADN